MTTRDDELRIRPGRIQHGNKGARPAKSFVGEVMQAAKKAGHVGNSFRSNQGRSRSRFGRGRRAAVSIRLLSNARRVMMKARVVRHQGTRFRSAPLPKHIAYLKREGVTRDGENARMFNAASDTADERAFTERCEDDRHHFRFIVSPEDGAEVRNAMDRRADHLVEEGLARRRGQGIIFAHDLLSTLRRRELDDAIAKLSTDRGSRITRPPKANTLPASIGSESRWHRAGSP